MARQRTHRKLFRIGEVSRLTGVNPHILRYWESEFQILAPNRRLSKQRLYRQADIDLIVTIKNLLDVEKYTLLGVKQYLQEHFADGRESDVSEAAAPLPEAVEAKALLDFLREELQAIRMIFDNRPKNN